MKGNIDSNENAAITDIAVIVTILFLSVLFLNTIPIKLKPQHDVLINRLKRDSTIVVEEAGESSTEYLYTLSISTLQQSFDLNMIYEQLRGTGCRLVSTADSAHPSYRKLSITIPKTPTSRWYTIVGFSGLMTLVLGLSFCILIFQIPMLYNYFSPWIVQLNGFIQT